MRFLDKTSSVHKYDQIDKPFRDTAPMDRIRKEPRFFSPKTYMTSVQKLLSVTCRENPVTVVYGNLGRHDLSYYLDLCYGYDEDVRVSTHYDWDTTGLDESYRDDGLTPCDILIVLEPAFDTIPATTKPLRIRKHVIVLTSHLSFKTDPKNVIAHYVGDAHDHHQAQGTITYVHSVQGTDCYVYRPPVFLRTHTELSPCEHLYVDLGDSRDAAEAYLRLLNAYDVRRFGTQQPPPNWTIVLHDDLQRDLVRHLENSKKVAYRVCKQCNLDGINVAVERFIDPYLPLVYLGGLFSNSVDN